MVGKKEKSVKNANRFLKKKTDQKEKVITNRGKDILIVGDWVVDENWTVATHQSSTSTEPVDIHYRSIFKPESSIYGFCGAGRVGRALYWMNRYNDEGEKVDPNNHPLINIYGLGFWNKKDTDHLRSLFQPDVTRGRTPYSLFKEPLNKKVEHVDLINLADAVEQKDGSPYTSRVYRVFRLMEEGKLDLVQRIDWEFPPAEFKDKYRERSVIKEKLDKLIDKNNLLDKRIEAIVVKCLGRGVMSEGLVEKLIERFPAAKWFVSSKTGIPFWLEKIKNLELLFLPPIPMENCEEVPRWFIGKGGKRELSREAIEYLRDKKKKYNPSFLVVMPHGLAIIATTKYPNNRISATTFDTFITRYENLDYDILPGRIGKASVFFAGLVANILFDLNFGGSFEEALGRCIEKTWDWRQNEENRLMVDLDQPYSQKSETAYGPNLLDKKEGLVKKWHIHGSCWDRHSSLWEQSNAKFGIIQEDDEFYFDLTRGMSVVDGYVAITKSRRGAVAQLYRMVQSFIKPGLRFNSKSSISCLLIDAPGRGKTLLVKRLSEQFNILSLSFNITQLLKLDDIINAFDVIVTSQAQDRQRAVLVFVDEIDANLSAVPVYDIFLAPIEDGIYLRGGNRFRIDPCIWIFAGTKMPVINSGKASDFVSRLSHGMISLTPSSFEQSSDPAEMHKRRLEQVYVSIAMLRSRYPDLKLVTKEVLEYFYRINPDVGMRKIRHAVERARDVQYATIEIRNLPTFEEVGLSDHILELSQVESGEEKIKIRLR